MTKRRDIKELEEKIGYHFKNPDYIEEALTHSSYANEMKINRKNDYERLEFLGDAVLELISSDFIFKNNPTMPEGKMTKLRASMVCEVALAYCAKDIELNTFIRLGKGEEATGGRGRDSIISDVCEATIGALYLDGGIEEAKKFIDRFILSDLEDKILFYDSKTVLQELIQAKEFKTFEYELVKEEGPDHAKVFVVNAVLDGDVIGTGEGKSKKAAEQTAAYEAIKRIKK